MPQLDGTTIGVIGTIVGTILGVSATVIVFFLQKNKTLLQYAISTTPLVTEKMAVILNDRMSIDGQPVKSMSSTMISFINSGNQRIKSSDFSEQEPLSIIVKGHLYGHDVSLGNQKLLPKVASVNDNVLNISFENLKPGQFFSVVILHDKADETVEVSGELTTGTMREYSTSKMHTYFTIISEIVMTALLIDYQFNGPVVTLIGHFMILILLVLLFLVTALVLIVGEFKTRTNKNKFFFH